MESSKPQQRVACIWLPNWPLQRLAAARPELSGRTVLLYESRANGGLKVVACCERARGAGVRVGMPLAEGISVVEGNARSAGASRLNGEDGIVVEAHDAVADRHTLEDWAGRCQVFSPSVALEEGSRPESLFCEVTGLANLFGGEAGWREQVFKAFNERGLTPRIAIAGTIGAAWALAHFGEDGDVASVVLDRLPIAALRLSAETVASLEELGIYQIGQVAKLPRETLGSRFGAELLLRLDQATGLLPEAIVSHKPPLEFEAEWLLEHATDRQETIDFVLETLVYRLTKQLAARREGVVRLEGRFQLQTGEPLQFSVGLYRPSAAAKHLLSLIQLRLERIRLRDAVTAIRLRATATGVLEMEQQGLFANESNHDAPRHLAALVDRLASRLGREAVLLPKLLADAQPEHACQYVPMAAEKKVRPSGKKRHGASRPVSAANIDDHRKNRDITGGLAPCRFLAGMRPLQLGAPVALGMMAVVPEGPPIRFRAAGAEQRVVNAWGPERIERGWWRRRGVRRDYYRVETQTGQRFWLFRRLSDGRWFWHGAFE